MNLYQPPTADKLESQWWTLPRWAGDRVHLEAQGPDGATALAATADLA
jgi:hypothetical protein